MQTSEADGLYAMQMTRMTECEDEITRTTCDAKIEVRPN